MKKLIYLICGIVFVFCASFTVSSGLPETEVWLFDFIIKQDKKTGFDKYSIGKGLNVSKHTGYDSQPMFSSGSDTMMWTSEYDGQTDIVCYSLLSKTWFRWTNTTVSEYSPTYTKFGLSCVVVEADSTQRLWMYDYRNKESHVIMPSVSKIGYHCWADTNTIFTFLLTEPFSLAKCDVKTGSTTTVAQNIGRCMNVHRASKMNYFYYTVKDTADNATIQAYDLDKNEVVSTFSIACPEGSEDFARYQRTFIMASGAELYYWDMSTQNNKWIRFADLSSSGIEHITRIAISPDGKHIAVVDNAVTK